MKKTLMLRNLHKILIRKRDRKRRLGIPRRGWVYIAIMAVNRRLVCVLNLFGSGWGQLNMVSSLGVL
jgi:hypothetical protein